MFQKRLRPASSNDLQAALKRAMIKKFLHERINKKFSDALLVSTDGEKKFRVGVIDFLTDYGTAKYLETKTKGLFSKGDSGEISCQPPPFYQERFIRYMREYF